MRHTLTVTTRETDKTSTMNTHKPTLHNVTWTLGDFVSLKPQFKTIVLNQTINMYAKYGFKSMLRLT